MAVDCFITNLNRPLGIVSDTCLYKKESRGPTIVYANMMPGVDRIFCLINGRLGVEVRGGSDISVRLG